MKLVSLAPRYIGDFEKGVDYKGDVAALERSLRDHAAIAEMLGPYKLSLHSGSDKLSIYPALARATKGRFHVKTAGTSYLEALRVVARHDAGLFRRGHRLRPRALRPRQGDLSRLGHARLGPAAGRGRRRRRAGAALPRTLARGRAGARVHAAGPADPPLHVRLGPDRPAARPGRPRRSSRRIWRPTPKSWPTTSVATWTPSGRGCEASDGRASYLDDLFGLDGLVAVVIGGTGVLCGALAAGLARAGATVVVAGRDPREGGGSRPGDRGGGRRGRRSRRST